MTVSSKGTSAESHTSGHSICPDTGLPILSKPEWSGVKLGDRYQVTYQVIGNRILFGQASGYAGHEIVDDLSCLMDSVIDEGISKDKPYVHISDYSRLRGHSPRLRRKFIEHVKKHKRLKGMVFFGLSPMMKLSIMLAKRLYASGIQVAVAENYSDAIEKAFEILNDDTEISRGSIPDKSGTEPVEAE